MSWLRSVLSRFRAWLDSGHPPKPDTYRAGEYDQPSAYREDGVATGGGAGNVRLGGDPDVGSS